MIVETIRDDFGLIPKGILDGTMSLKRHAGNGYGLATKLARGAVSMPPCAPFVYAVRTAPFQGVEASANLAWSDFYMHMYLTMYIYLKAMG